MSFLPQSTLLLYTIIHAITFLKFSLGADTLFPDQKIVNGQTLISQNQMFEMGFFYPGTSIKGFLGIWYKSTPDIVVWVANRNNPITDSQGVLLSIARNGTLVISRGGGISWSSNSSGSASSPILQLLDTGNLVVVDKANNTSYIWQSFDYPSDTRLPGMKMVNIPATGEEKYLTSWRSPDDPSPGDFIYKIEYNGLAEVVILRGEMKRYRTGPWNGLYLSGIPPGNPNFLKSNGVFKKDIIISVFEPYNSSNIERVTIEQSGSVQRYRMNERRDKWNIVFTIPRDPCDYYAQCGPYGVCSIERVPICECLKGFSPGGQGEWDWSGGCTRIRPLNCENGDGFLEVKGVKFPDMLNFWLNTSMSLGECRGECLKKCNCTAYANPYLTGGGSGCLMWFGDLIDIRENQGADRQIIYIRLPVSELEMRPVMSSVLFMLANEEAILPEPKEPGFFAETSSSGIAEDHISRSEESKKGTMTISELEAR
ncbi:hypothetical protein BUALT_Bualt18G0058100 [Buddleja alternifolia]|uniref:non-specific serine/threonine protein kinase n=1 Tax=Buddleja alternifolia TaxID=168488 RepID=A0AAV6W208_9LAMI|nr:hypothetical protein BUALT_Bualt18G0058100 [Buddleja alternifolia]